MPWVLGLVLKVARQFRDISPRDRSNQLAEGPHQSKINYGKRSWQDINGEKFLHRTEDRRMFSAEDNWVLFKKRRLWLSTHACHGRPWGQRGMKWRYARNAHLEQANPSVPKMKKQTDVQSLNGLKASPVTEAENSLSIAGKMKKIVAWFSTSSRVSWLQVWKQMHSWLLSTSWRWEETQPEVEKKVLKDQFLFWKKVQGCVSQDSDPMNSIQRKVEELGLNASAGHTWNSQDALGTKLSSGKKKAIWRHYPKRWTSWAKSLRAQFWGTTTWRNLTTSRLYQQSGVDFGVKICKLKTEDNYVSLSCEGARDTEDGQGDGVPKAGPQQAAADSWGSRTCVCASTLGLGMAHARREGRINVLPWHRLVGVAKTSSESHKEEVLGCPQG